MNSFPVYARAVIWATLIVTAAPAWAQQAGADGAEYQLPRGWIIAPAAGLLPEPSLLSKFALSSETAFGSAPPEGWYVQTSGVITGQGWISLGPGYRRTVLGGRGRVNETAALSWYLSSPAQAAFAQPQPAHGRLTLATEARGHAAR